MNKKIQLSKSIMAHGETITELTINEPTLGALENVHISVADDGSIKFNLGDLQGLISNVAGIPLSSVRQISLKDAPKLFEVAKDFFGDFLQVSGK